MNKKKAAVKKELKKIKHGSAIPKRPVAKTNISKK